MSHCVPDICALASEPSFFVVLGFFFFDLFGPKMSS